MTNPPNRVSLPDGEVLDVQYSQAGGQKPLNPVRIEPGAAPGVAQGAAEATGRVQPHAPQSQPVAASGAVQPGANPEMVAQVERAKAIEHGDHPHMQQGAVVRDFGHQVVAEIGTVVAEPGYAPDEEAPHQVDRPYFDPASLPTAHISKDGLRIADQLLPSGTMSAPLRIEHVDRDGQMLAVSVTYLVRSVESDPDTATLIEEVPYHEVSGDTSLLEPQAAKVMDLFYRTRAHLRRFVLQRNRDETGVTGTGIVAEGIVFNDGKVVLRWLGAKSSIVVWDDLETAMQVHGHGGATRLRWIDAGNRAVPHHPDNPQAVKARAAVGMPTEQRQ